MNFIGQIRTNLRLWPIFRPKLSHPGGGNQGAIPPAVFNALREWWPHSEPVEAFASPLNLSRRCMWVYPPNSQLMPSIECDDGEVDFKGIVILGRVPRSENLVCLFG